GGGSLWCVNSWFFGDIFACFIGSAISLLFLALFELFDVFIHRTVFHGTSHIFQLFFIRPDDGGATLGGTGTSVWNGETGDARSSHLTHRHTVVHQCLSIEGFIDGQVG